MKKISPFIDKPILERYGGFVGGGVLVGYIFSSKMWGLAEYPRVSFGIFTIITLWLVWLCLRMFAIQYKYKNEISLMAIAMGIGFILYYIFRLPKNFSL